MARPDFPDSAESNTKSQEEGIRAALQGQPNIVLVHGAWGDGSSWSGVIKRLQADGFHVRAPQFSLTSLSADVDRLRQVLEFQEGATVLAGHCYGGQVITALGKDAASVVGLVYVAAYVLDEGESLGAILAQGPRSPALSHLFADSRASFWISEDDFVDHFASGIDKVQAKVLYAAQQALPASVITDHMREPAWKSFPSWYLVAQNDEAIPPETQRHFAARIGATTAEVESGHLPIVSHPKAVADFIEMAAKTVLATS